MAECGDYAIAIRVGTGSGHSPFAACVFRFSRSMLYELPNPQNVCRAQRLMICLSRCRAVRRLAVFLFSLCLMACGPAPEPLRIGTNPWPSYELLHRAQQRGYFAAEGVQVELVSFMSLGDSRRAYERGQTDVMAATVGELLISRANTGADIQAFALINWSEGGDVLLARRDIASLADLRGKRVAFEPGSFEWVLLDAALREGGLTLADVRPVAAPHSRLPGLWREGAIDAAIAYPPYAPPLDTDAHVLFDTARMPGVVADVLAADRALIAARKQELAAVLRAYERARQDLLRERQQVLQQMAPRLQLSAADLDTQFRGIRMVSADEQRHALQVPGELTAALRRNAEVLVQAKVLPALPETEQMVTDSVIAEWQK